MKQYLIDTFKYNDWANRKLLETIQQLPDKMEAIKLFSHVINAQDKWYNRITKKTEDTLVPWMTHGYPVEELESRWDDSINLWVALLESKNENDLQEDVLFNRATDGKQMGIKLIDLCLQINYHSMHHRAQINTLISKQGLTPPPTDYIYTKLKEL